MRLQGTLSIVACTVETGSSRRILLVTLSLFCSSLLIQVSTGLVKKQTCPKKFYLHGVLFVEIYPWQISHLCRPGTTIVVYITNDLKASSLISAWTHSLGIQGKSERDYTIEFLLYVSLKLRSLIFLDIRVVS